MIVTTTEYVPKEKRIRVCDKCGATLKEDDGSTVKSLLGFYYEGLVASKTQIVHREHYRKRPSYKWTFPGEISIIDNPDAADGKFADEVLSGIKDDQINKNVFDLCDECWEKLKAWIKEK